MNFNDFQKSATRTLNAEQEGYIKSLTNCGFGITGETGEVVDILKKHLFHGHTLDQDKLKEELGDVLWYVSCIAYLTDINLQDVAEHNIAKLLKRYPRGFNTKSSMERMDTKSVPKEQPQTLSQTHFIENLGLEVGELMYILNSFGGGKTNG